MSPPAVATRAWRHGRGRTGVRAGLVALAVVLLVGLPAAWARQPGWQAHSSLLVLPTATADPDQLASLYDTLSRGQVPATYAELLRDSRPAEVAAAALGLSAAQRASLAVDVEVVPDTSVLDITVTASQPSVALSVADRVADIGNRRIEALGSPYGSRTLSGATGTALRQPLGRVESLALVGVLAVLAGLVTQQLVRQLRPSDGSGSDRSGVRGGDPRDRLFPGWDDGPEPPASDPAAHGARAPAGTGRPGPS